ncbi:hypothetical protein SKAU_G00158240 [Synaphobranchus kaupii]|uniref:Uncharacterized protein n=1 Tax=Synaphobranchus kaupii TaxID=118154 RepID=A0A9Q1FHZ9_SYNKA|nr:hypothetical protein SKAU_G00158240 [Synaphobranchus kaupii]
MRGSWYFLARAKAAADEGAKPAPNPPLRTLTPGLLPPTASYNAGINRGFIETPGFVIWASFFRLLRMKTDQ